MSTSLQTRVALITGGGTGIGFGIAQALLAAGASVAISGRRAETLEKAVRTLDAEGTGRVLAVAGDISNAEDAERMVGETVKHFGALHILVNNAGIARYGALDGQALDDIDTVLQIGLRGPILVTRAALPFLRRHKDDGGASVISISSSVTQAPIKNFAVYSAVKAGVDMLTRCCAIDYAEDGVRFNAICPGIVETPIFETMMPKEAIDRALREFAKATPLGRVGQPTDIANLTLFLASDAGSWMTGAILPLDGGLSMTGA